MTYVLILIGEPCCDIWTFPTSGAAVRKRDELIRDWGLSINDFEIHEEGDAS